MSTISYTVEDSCYPHPLIPGGTLPCTGQVSISARRLFSFASLIYQDASVGRDSLADTTPLWQSLHSAFQVYLTFSKNDIVATASGERLTDLSELVGIGCGLAVLKKESCVNLNRLVRFNPKTKQRRADFQFYHQNLRYFHECKGLTYDNQLTRARDSAQGQKTQTGQFCSRKQNAPPMVAATGTVTLYQHTIRQKFSTHVYLIDPPLESRDITESPIGELISILRHYRNFYRITHVNPRNEGLIGIADWLSEVIKSLEAGHTPPRSPPKAPRLVVQPRLSEPGVENSEYKGTLFDARIARSSIERFRSFEDATQSIAEPVTFVGISNAVTTLIATCKWDELLQYTDPNSNDDDVGREILDSGVLTKAVRLSDSEERQSRIMFESDRRRFETLKQ